MEIRPGYSAPADAADYAAIEQAVDEHNAAAQPGERYWGISYENGKYTVYEAGEVPQPPTAEELAAQEAERKKQAEREALPDTVKALQDENAMLKQCLMEMSEIVYA